MKARICGEIKHSSVNGVGVRYVVFFQGCPHNCLGCHNPETHSIDGGYDVDVEEVITRINTTKLRDGVTLSGGDPFVQPKAMKEIADAAHKRGLDVWAYSGWTSEQLMSGVAGEDAKDALQSIDVLVDGPFIQALKSEECIWRGSTNQRLIDVQASISTNSVKEKTI